MEMWSGPSLQSTVIILGPLYRACLSPNYGWFQWNICNGCGMQVGNAYLSGRHVPSFFGTCLCSNCWDQFSQTCRVISRLFIFNTPRYSRFCFQTSHVSYFWAGRRYYRIWSMYSKLSLTWARCLRFDKLHFISHHAKVANIVLSGLINVTYLRPLGCQNKL